MLSRKPPEVRRITIIQGHPDASELHFCHAIAASYEAGAKSAGHQVRTIDVGKIQFPLVRNKQDFESGDVPAVIRAAQEDVRWAQHLVIVYPLWLGTLPALLKGFFEQTFRYGFAMGTSTRGMPKKLLAGRSARIVVTMGMPATAYRYLFRAHGLKSLESAVLAISGIRPIRSTLIGMVENRSARYRAEQLEEIHKLGRRAS